MKRILNTLFTLLVVTFLSACVGGDSDTTDDSPVQTGVLVDSAVAGVTYKTATQSGITDSNGNYKYLAGETVTFSIGDIVFPAVTAKGTITPLDLSGGDINTPKTINIARLLQSLDTDNNPSNGITIDASTVASGTTLDFNKSVADFETEVTAKLTNITFVSQSSAISHLQSQLSTTGTPNNSSVVSQWNTTDKGIPLLEKATNSYSVYVWQTTNSNIPIGNLTFNFSKVGIQGKVTDTSGNINITTTEGGGTGDIRGDLSDFFGEGFIYLAGSYRFIFGLGSGTSTFEANFFSDGKIEGTYKDNNGEIKFSNSTKDKFSPTPPTELTSKAGTYQGDGYILISGPGSFSISNTGVIQYTEPKSCTVKTVTWDGNGDVVRENGNIIISDPATGQQISINLINVAAGFEYRIGGPSGANIYRLNNDQSSSNVADNLDGTYGLSVCNARKTDITPPQITLLTDIVIEITSGTTSPKTSAIFQYLAGAKAEDTITATVKESINVTNDAPNIYPLGNTTVTFSATDKQGNQATETGKITVQLKDIIAPNVNVPANITIAATNRDGTLAVQSTLATWLASATATDNRDGNITAVAKNVSTNYAIGTRTITFEATDSSGNTGSATSELTIADITAPVITLTGDANTTITQGASYTEQGATATDNVDFSRIVTIGGDTVDTSTPNTYTITYSATDNAGNSAELSRTVEVKAPPAFDLVRINPLTPSQNLNKVIYGDKFVAVGDSGTIITSTDGTTWVTRQSQSDQKLYDICYANSQYWVVGAGQTTLTSNDGITWTDLNATNTVVFTQLACNNNTLVARAYKSGLYHSTDGITWHGITNVLNTESVKFLNGQFITTGTNGQFTSNDGLTWINVSNIAGLFDVTWDGTAYYFTGYIYSGYWASLNYSTTDFTNYTTLSPSGADLSDKLFYLNNKFFMFGWVNSGDIFVADTLGGAWSAIDGTPPVTDKTALSVAYNNNTSTPAYVIVGTLGVIYSSTDLTTWTAQKKLVTTQDLKEVAWDNANTTAIAVGAGGTIVRSTDLTNWNTVTSGVTINLNAVTYGDQFIAVGDSGVILTSTDGLTWATQTSGTNNSISQIAFNPSSSTYVATALNVALTSTNGTTWVANNITTNTTIKKLIWDSAQFVAISSTLAYTSTNGITWEDKGKPGSSSSSAITWDGERYLTTYINGGALYASTDLSSWTYTGGKVGTSYLLNGQLVTNGYPTHIIGDSINKKYLATLAVKPVASYTALNAGLVTSLDTKTWTSRGAINETFYHIVKAGNKYIMVGKEGVIFTGSYQLN